MTIQNLYHYTKTWSFLHDVKNAYDLVIREQIPDITQLPASSKTEHITFAELWYDMRPTGDVINRITTAKRVLVILDTITSTTIAPIVSVLPNNVSVTIINLGAGVTGIINKHTIDNDDMWIVLSADLPTIVVREPVDARQFISILEKTIDHTYIRIPHDEFPEHLFEEKDQSIYNDDYISMQWFGYTGISGTVISIASLLPYVSQALQYVDTTNGKKFDLFVCTWYTTNIGDTLLHSIKHTGKLILIHDQKDNIALKEFVEKLLEKNWLTDIQVIYKHPSYEVLTTLLPAYIHEQAGVGSENLAQYLISLG